MIDSPPLTGCTALPYGWETTVPPNLPSSSASRVSVPAEAEASAEPTLIPDSTMPGTVGWAYPPNSGCGVWMRELGCQ